jgi:hypothetical protein
VSLVPELVCGFCGENKTRVVTCTFILGRNTNTIRSEKYYDRAALVFLLNTVSRVDQESILVEQAMAFYT